MNRRIVAGSLPRAVLAAAAAATLAGCGAGRDQCLRAVTEDIRTLDRLIAETEAGRARGYGTARQELPYLEHYRCPGYPRGTGHEAPTCLTTETMTIETPVALDPAAEDRKLAALKARREALVPRALDQIAECKARYGGA